jgi:glutaminyl-peptide cyclotransferase
MAVAVLCATTASWHPPVAARQRAAAPPIQGYRIVNTYPHDRHAFTQGLIFLDGFLYESTGLNGRSSVRKVRLETGEVLQQRAVDPKYFAEGLTDWGAKLIQLTWQTNVGFVYDRASFQPERSFPYTGEGWGITHDKTRLIMSDGTAEGGLRFLDPETLRETGRIVVRDRGRPVQYLNELEYIRGEVWANIWQTDRLVRINPKSGDVIAWVDLTGLIPRTEVLEQGAVLNGIAYDAAGDRIFVTGKLWPKLFEIRVGSLAKGT